MPTAARLISAVLFALIGILVAGVVKPLLPEGQPTPYLYPVVIVIPMLCAWRVIGRLIGRGAVSAINTGVYGIVCAITFSVLAFAIGEMLKRSMRLQYGGPMDAITGMFGIFLEYAQLLIHPMAIGYLLVGGIVTGLIAEWSHHKWG
ncbi:MAG: TrgA family protein [Litoreibacter sp.]|nr:TrgA family protein [Litoreibacter sp.]